MRTAAVGASPGAPPGWSGRRFTSAPSRRARPARASASASVSFLPAISTYSNVTRFRNAPGGVEHRSQVVFLLDRHERAAAFRRCGMQRYRETKLLRPLRQRDHAGQDSHRRDGDMARADPAALGPIERRERGAHRRPVEQRLAHAHEHDVGGLVCRISEHQLAGLSGDLERREIPPESHLAGGAEDAPQGTASLGRHAQSAAAAGGDQHGLDRFAVVEPPQIFRYRRQIAARYRPRAGQAGAERRGPPAGRAEARWPRPSVRSARSRAGAGSGRPGSLEAPGLPPSREFPRLRHRVRGPGWCRGRGCPF